MKVRLTRPRPNSKFWRLTYLLAFFLFSISCLQAQSYVSSTEAAEILEEEMERIATTNTPVAEDDLVQDMAKELINQISNEGVAVNQAVETLFNYYESKRSTWPQVDANLDNAKSKIESLLIE